MRDGLRALLWIGILTTGAVILWRASLSLSAKAPFPIDHGERLAFGVTVTGIVAGLSCAMSYARPRLITWSPLDRRTFSQTASGAAAFAALAIPATATLAWIGLTDIGLTRSSETALTLAYLLLLVLLSEALPEELLFRGWIMQALEKDRSPWKPVLGQALVFSLFAWVVGAVSSVTDASFIACFGIVLGIVRAVTGTIWTSVGLHLAFITAQQSALPSWAIWGGDPHPPVQIIGLTILPFSIIVGILYGRVKPS
jgi:CAAX amino terminal protease family.